MTNLIRITMTSFAAALILGSSAASADHDHSRNDTESLLLNVASTFLATDAILHASRDRPQRGRQERVYRDDSSIPGRGFIGGHSKRDGYRGASFTSEPIRGGSSRRTRIVENPYPNRPLSGISFTGIEHDAVHINDVITYPRKRLISRSGYSLSLYHPSRFLSTRGYVDYISVKAKRKEYFTVTFHYQ